MTQAAAGTQVSADLDITVEFNGHLATAKATLPDGTLTFTLDGSVSLGEIVNALVDLVEPGRVLQFDPPWNALTNITLTNPDFILGRGTVGFGVDRITPALGNADFLQLTSFHLLFTRASGSAKKQLQISLDGELFGQRLDQPLSWDLLRQPPPPPAAPAKSAPILDLEYLGLGQHVSLAQAPVAAPNETQVSMADVIAALEGTHQDNVSPAVNQGLKFDAGSNWLIGAKFSVLGTVALSVVFNDPSLYGLVVALSGARAKVLAGLSFEILYRKISPNLGVYHIELKLPDAFRRIEVGAATLTLPIIDVDIYTDGSFLIDFGFPRNHDYTRSFTIELIVLGVPVLGAGGFYFGVLSPQAATDVRTPDNGEFRPIIVFGIGLRIGLGKTIDKGLLKAGFTITVEGILEGVLAFFHPTDPAVATDTYFKISGSIAIVGHLYGSIDFAVIKAQVDVLVFATVQLDYEIYAPAHLTLSAGVSIHVTLEVNLGIFQIDIHFSFEATITAEFTIGSQSPTPWHFPPKAPTAAEQAVRIAPTLRTRALDAAATLVSAKPVAIPLTFQLMPTVGNADGGTIEAQLVAMLFIQTDDFTRVATSTFRAALNQAAQSAGGAPNLQQQLQSLSTMLDTFTFGQVDSLLKRNFTFTIQPPPDSASQPTVGTGQSGTILLQAPGTVKPAQSAPLSVTLAAAAPKGGVTVALSSTDAFKVTVAPASVFIAEGATAPAAQPQVTGANLGSASIMASADGFTGAAALVQVLTDMTVFPMLPSLSMTTGGRTIDFASQTSCTPDYLAFLADYLRSLAAKSEPPAASTPPTGTVSMAACLFTDCFLMILRQALQDSVDAVQADSSIATSDGLVDSLTSSGAFAKYPGTVARFLMHGLRLPGPDADPSLPRTRVNGHFAVSPNEQTFPLYVLSGQQFKAVNSVGTDEVDVTAPGATLKIAASSGNFPDFAGAAAAFDPLTTRKRALTGFPPYAVISKRFALGKPVVWRPAHTAKQIFALPASLRTQIAADTRQGLDLRVMVGQPGPPPVDPAPVAAPQWAIGVDFTLRQVAEPSTGVPLPFVYEISSTDPDGRIDLQDLRDALNAPQTALKIQTIELLFTDTQNTPGLISETLATEPLLLRTNLSTSTRTPTDSSPELAAASRNDSLNFLTMLWESAVVHTGGYYLVYKGADPQGLPPALFAQSPTATLTVLITISGDSLVHTFHNSVSFAQQTGRLFIERIPYIVSQGDTLKTIAQTLGIDVIELGASNATTAGLLQAGQSVAITGQPAYTIQHGDDLLGISLATNTSLTNVISAVAGFAMQDDPATALQLSKSAAWVLQRPTMPPGNAGFRLILDDPRPATTPAQRMQTLFSLLGFHLNGEEGFNTSPEGLPAGPSNGDNRDANPPAGSPWIYQQVLTIAPFAKNQRTPPQPIPGQDPYAGLGTTARLSFHFQDVFGNRCQTPTSSTTLDLKVRYADHIIGLEQWPGLLPTFTFRTGQQAPQLQISLGFDSGRYASAGAALNDRAKADRDRYQQIFFQIDRRDVSFAARTTPDGELAHALDSRAFKDFAVAAHDFAAAMALLVPVTDSVSAGDTLKKLAARWNITAGPLGVANQALSGLLTAGTSLKIPHDTAVLAGESLQRIATRTNGTAANIASLNRGHTLQPGTILVINPQVSLTVKSGDTLDSVATGSGVTFDQLLANNKAVVNLFTAGDVLDLGPENVTTADGDTLGSIASAHKVDTATLAEAISDTAVLVATTSLSIPGHFRFDTSASPPGASTGRLLAGDTLRGIASRSGVALEALAGANQLLDGLLASGVTLTCPVGPPDLQQNLTVITLANDNLATVLARFQSQPPGSGLTLADVASANQDVSGLLQTGTSPLFVVPPKGSDLPAVAISAAFPSVVFPVRTTVRISRDETAGNIDPLFAADDAVKQADSELRPGIGAGDDSSKLQAFALDFETAFPELKLAVGTDPPNASGGQNSKLLVAVQFHNQVLDFAIQNPPFYFAPKPLLNTTWTENAVPIQPYASGQPLGTVVATNFRNIDLDKWARVFLADVDLFLLPQHAAAAQQLDPSSFQTVVEAKNTLASAIRDRVAEIVDSPGVADLDAAKEIFYERLLVRLADAYAVDAIVQFPATLSYPASEPRARISFQPSGDVFLISPGATLASIASQFQADLGLLARTIQDAPILTGGDATLARLAARRAVTVEALAADTTNPPPLKTGASLNLVRRTHVTADGETLRNVLEYLAPDLSDETAVDSAIAGFVSMNARAKLFSTPGLSVTAATVKSNLDTKGALNSKITLSFLALLPAFTVSEAKLDLKPGFAIPQGATLASIAAQFQADLVLLARTIADLPILTGSDDTLTKLAATRAVTVEALAADPANPPPLKTGANINLVRRTHVTAAGETLRSVIEDLAPGLADQTALDSAIAGFVAMNAQASLFSTPGLSVTAPNVTNNLDNAGALNSNVTLSFLTLLPATLSFLFSTAAEAQFRSFSLNIGFQANILEHDIQPVSWAPGYESSDLLTFVRPATEPSVAVDIPIPLRASPVPPSVVSQAVQQTLKDHPTLSDLKSYQYSFKFAIDLAAQDDLFTGISINVTDFAGALTATSDPTGPLPQALAQYAAIADALKQDLPSGILPATDPEKATAFNAVQIFARQAAAVATAWASWNPAAVEPQTALEATGSSEGNFDIIGGRSGSAVTAQRTGGFDIIAAQNARGGVSVTRNARLVAGRPTVPEFVYQVPEVSFTNPLVPLFANTEPLDLDTLPELSGLTSLKKKLAAFFGALLEVTPSSPQTASRDIRVGVSFEFALASAKNPVPTAKTPSITTVAPVLLTPKFSFDPTKDLDDAGGFCAQLSTALEGWLASNSIAPGGGSWLFDISLYSTLGGGPSPAPSLPLLELEGLFLTV